MQIPTEQIEKLTELSKKINNNYGVFFNIVDKDAKEIFSYNLNNFWKHIQKNNTSLVKSHYLQVIEKNKADRKILLERTDFGLYTLSMPVVVNKFYEGSIIVGPFKKDDFNLIEVAIASGLNEDEIVELDDSILFDPSFIDKLSISLDYISYYVSALFQLSTLNNVNDQFLVLKKITQITNNYLELSDLLKSLVKAFVDYNVADNCSITLFKFGKRYSAIKVPDSYKSIEHENVEEIKKTLRPAYSANIHLQNNTDISMFSYKNVSSFPLFNAKEGLLGVITLFHDNVINSRLVEAISDTIAIAMQSAAEYSRINDESRTDPLTGFFNRRAFMDIFQESIDDHKGTKKSLSVAMIDIDHFGHYNNTNGHPAGDKLLKQMSDIFRDVFADNIIGRYGGEEFIVLFKNKSFSDVKDFCLNLITKVNQTQFEFGQTQPGNKVTLSVGLFTAIDSSCTVKEMIDHADSMLYKSKNNGRNQLSVSFKASYGTNVIEV